jgi:hypothetical protein
VVEAPVAPEPLIEVVVVALVTKMKVVQAVVAVS